MISFNDSLAQDTEIEFIYRISDVADSNIYKEKTYKVQGLHCTM